MSPVLTDTISLVAYGVWSYLLVCPVFIVSTPRVDYIPCYESFYLFCTMPSPLHGIVLYIPSAICCHSVACHVTCHLCVIRTLRWSDQKCLWCMDNS